MVSTRTPRLRRPRAKSLVADFARWLLSISLITALIIAAGMVFIQARLDEEIRAHLERKFQANYPNLIVSIGAARRIEGHGIEVRSISISEVDHNDDLNVLLFVEELFVKCDATLAEIARGKPRARQITLRRPLIQARRRPDGSWNVDQLLPLPKFSDTLPPTQVEEGTFELIEATTGVPRRLTLRNIGLTVAPVAFTKTTPEGDELTSISSAMRAQGSFSSDHFEQTVIDAQFDLTSPEWGVQGAIEQLRVSPSLIEALPDELASKLRVITPARGSANIRFKMAKHGPAPGTLRYQAQGTFTGRIEDPRLPRPLEHVGAEFYCDERQLRVDRLVAASGETRLEASYRMDGWQPTSRKILEMKATSFAFDRTLNAAIPHQWREIWNKFQPEGLVDLDLMLHFNGTRWLPAITADFVEMSFAYEKFPYRLKQCQGRVHFENEELILDNLQAQASGRRVSINGRIIRPGPEFTGWVEVSANEPLDIDEQLIGAMSGKAQEFVRSLSPHGEITAWGRLERTDPSQPATKRFDIGLRGCSIKYERFPYPIYEINGNLKVVNNEISFDDLQGKNDSGFIDCAGRWQHHADGSALSMRFNCEDVPLEDELRHALKPNVQEMWSKLRPRGTIDRLQVDVDYTTAGGLSVGVMAQKRRSEQNVAGRSITIRPDWFAYQMDNLIGTVYFKDGIVELKNLHAQHGVTEVRLDGQIATSDNRWKVRLSNLHVNRLHTTHELCAALPPALGSALTKLNLTGPVSMSGLLQIEGSTDNSSPRQAGWNLEFDVEDGNLHCGQRLEHLRGGLTLVGNYQDGKLSSSGNLAMESLIYKGVQLTQIRGPFSLDSEQIAFGEKAEVPQGTPPRPLYAAVFDGTLAANARIWYADNGRFELDARLQEADLTTISKEATTRGLDISGQTFANLYLAGNSRGMHSLRGRGSVELRDADIYEFPILVEMLAFLSLRRPDRVGFTTSNMDFRVEADRLYFDRIDFAGDAISLYGRGEISKVTTERKLNLIFDTSVGRDDNQQLLAGLIRPLLKEAGKRILVVYAGGTLDVPLIRRQPFPELNETFQQVFPGQPPPRNATISRLPRSGGVRQVPSPRR